jgi:hypothetical protein
MTERDRCGLCAARLPLDPGSGLRFILSDPIESRRCGLQRFVRVLRLCTAVSCVRERLELLALVLIGLGHAILHAIEGGPPPPGAST